MELVALLAVCLLAAVAPVAADENSSYTLPENFLLGAGTSAYQTEGAWSEDGKGLNVFDYASHTEGTSPNGDVAADFYHRYPEDIKLAAEIGFNVFRLSISWPRIFPNGRNTSINQKGVDHYHKVLDALIENKLEPMVTLYHFDHPQALENKIGGWLGDEMPDLFAAFADFAFKTYGSKVKYWLTINEASLYCTTLGSGFLEPKAFNTPEKQNICLRNTLFAHAKAYEIYEKNYKATQKGQVGFGTGPRYWRAANASNSDDVALAAKNNDVDGISLTIDPLVFGDWPEAAKASRNLLALTEDEQKLVKGRVDFLGVNMYGGQLANSSESSGGGGGGGAGGGGSSSRPDGFGKTETAWVLRDMPKWVKARYDSLKQLPIFITENGIHEEGNSTKDDWDLRATYCSAFIREMVAGVNEDGTRVFGYTMWSLMDTFEFHSYSNWGVVHVDYDSGSLARTKKASWTFFRRVMDTRVVPLVETGSTPFPAPSSSAAVGASVFLSLSALVFVLCNKS